MPKEDPTRVGLEIGTAIGAIGLIEEQTMVLNEEGPRRINPLNGPMVMLNAASCQVAVLIGAQGPTNSPAAACATGTYAIGQALMHLQRGNADVMIAGGTESCITPLGVASFGRLGALSTRNDEPGRACRPFDADRDGTVMGEGAAVIVMETLEHALKRDAPILAEAAGYGVTEDAFHMTAPDPEGSGAARAIRMALGGDGLSPDDVDFVAAHGTGTPLNDPTETKAIRQVFGDHADELAISANKSMLGHMFGAAGSISVVTAVLAIRDGMVPPTINLETPDPECDLDYVPLVARPARVDAAIANAFGFGGQNASFAVKRYLP
jgi:3-oxoacyl-[acyl-carrier-protein] synthase II